MEQDLDTLMNRVVSTVANYNTLVSNKNSVSKTISGLESEIAQLSADKETLFNTWNALRSLLDMFSSKSIEMLRDMMNNGLKTIFHDRDYSIKFEIPENTKMKKLKMYLIEDKGEGDIIESDINMIGGGVRVVLSFIFQIFLIHMYGKRPFICVDEGFTNISQSYVDNFMRFLQHLSTSMGFNFLMVNHDVRLEPYFNKVYRVSMGDTKLVSKTSNGHAKDAEKSKE